MAERYTKLFSLEKNLYCSGAPVILSAGSLLYDSFSSNMLAQLKFKNISPNPISALKIKIHMLDTTHSPLGEPVVYQYLDLHAARDDSFGRNTAVVLPESGVRSFTVEIAEVVFADSQIWQASGEAWSPLKPQQSLEDSYEDVELANQYRIRYGSNCNFAPLEDMGLWFCSCGAVNTAEEKGCHVCRRTLTAQKAVSLSALRSESALRLKAEQERALEEQALEEQKKKKRVRLAAILIPVILAVVLLIAIVPGFLKNARAYDSAMELCGQQRYEEAIAAFQALGDYKDSPEQAEFNVPYQRALYIMDCAERGDDSALSLAGISRSAAEAASPALLLYQAAIEQFTALGDYKDSIANIEKCKAGIAAINEGELQAVYEQAVSLMDSGSYCQARDAFLELDGYLDSAELAKESIYRKAVSLYEFMEKYKVQGIYANISTQTDLASVFSIQKSAALELGEGCISELRAACGADKADINLETGDESDTTGLLPFGESLSQLFASLGSYSDSPEYIEKISQAMDYTREFYLLCQQGDIYGAYDWLNAYTGEFENRQSWLDTLELYKPYCSGWELYSGDSSLLPLSAGKTLPCGTFSSCVIIQEGTATLRFSVSGDESYDMDFSAALGDTGFINNDSGVFSYYATINNLDRMIYMQYDSNGNARSSCEYSRV